MRLYPVVGYPVKAVVVAQTEGKDLLFYFLECQLVILTHMDVGVHFIIRGAFLASAPCYPILIQSNTVQYHIAA